MGKHIDKFFSALPFLFIIYHTILMSKCYSHFFVLLKITINYVLSMAFKHVFKKRRRTKDYKFEEWTIPEKLQYLKTHYSFPSNHTMFFVKYMCLFPTFSIGIVCLIGTISRVFYQHHTVEEVVFAALFVITIEFIIKFILKL